NMKTIYLIGFMGSGKTSVGRRLSDLLHIPFVDTDEAVEKTYGRIADIFEREGEEAFRTYESIILQGIPSEDRVVSTGGGFVEVRKKLEYTYYTAIVAYLQASVQQKLQRLKYDRNRPLWNQDCDTRKHLYNRRQILYEAYADVTINTDSRSIDNIAREIRQFV